MFENILAIDLFGNTPQQIILFLIIIAGFYMAAKIIKKNIFPLFKKVTEKTKTNFDDIIFSFLGKTIVPLSLVIGLYFGLGTLHIPSFYISTINDFFYILILIILAWLLILILDTFVEEWFKPLAAKTETDIDDQLIPLFSKTIKIIVIIITGIMILSELKFDVTALVASFGIGGLALAFAAQETIADIFGGITILTSRPFKTGDYIEIEGLQGTVVEISLRHTKIHRFEGGILTIPNRKVTNSIIRNNTAEKKRKVVLKIGLTYETDIKKIELAKKTITDLLKEKKEVDEDIIVRFDGFGDFSLILTVIYYIKDKKNWLMIRSDINTEIKKQFDSKGIDFAYPTQTLYIKAPEKVDKHQKKII